MCAPTTHPHGLEPMRSVVLLSLLLALPAAAERIPRSAAEVLAFKRHNLRPATGQRRGACPGYAVDHVVPLGVGGQDLSENMQWIKNRDHRIKTLVDVRECQKLRRMANTPARMSPDAIDWTN